MKKFTAIFRRFVFSLILLSGNLLLFAQEKEGQKDFSLSFFAEANYSGYNLLGMTTRRSGNHLPSIGFLYNLSDGFSTRAVWGLAASYHYVLAQSLRFKALTGIDYRYQKPLDNLHIHLLNYSLGIECKLNEHIGLQNSLGYGTALERAYFQGNRSKSNLLSGSIRLGCYYVF